MQENNNPFTQEYDVIIIGGGITGAGTARDCALRGLKVLLVERYDFTNGATGRNHGLMHSGARYAVTDQESATECIGENMILRHIARHCIEETDGLFVTLPEDDLDYQATFVDACLRAGINAEIIDPAEARIIEPSVNPMLIGAVRVPDASIDPFTLTTANLIDARRHGAVALTYHEVIDLIVENACVVGVRLRNNLTGETSEAYAPVTVNAAGIWGTLVAKKAGVVINMFPAKGSLLIFGHRVNNMVINRCRKPANGDILVPDKIVSMLGTTSDRVPITEIDNMRVTPEEVEILLKEGVQLVPSLARTRILRAYAGVRPLVASDDDPSGRSISRGIVLLDHKERDGMDGFVTITGGKLITYRLMAERATDLVCQKIDKEGACTTAILPLPGSDEKTPKRRGNQHAVTMKAAQERHGSLTNEIKEQSPEDKAMVCECEHTSVGEMKYAIEKLHVNNLTNMRRRTRMGMGSCQGKLCACRAATLLCKASGDAESTLADLASFMNERWKGMRPVAWGSTLNEAQLTTTIYEGLCGLSMDVKP
jgi:glycerol-3-phosphate dehydrogenase